MCHMHFKFINVVGTPVYLYAAEPMRAEWSTPITVYVIRAVLIGFKALLLCLSQLQPKTISTKSIEEGKHYMKM